MASSQQSEFIGRLQRVDRINRKGGGFEATGTLGRSFYNRKPRNRSFLRPLIFIAAGFLLIKAMLLTQIGAIDYQERVDRLAAGTQVEKAGAYVMQMDAATVWISETLREIFKTPG